MTATQERQTFAAQYQEEAKEILVLTAGYHKGFMRTDENTLWQTSCDLIAWLEDGELRQVPFARLEQNLYATRETRLPRLKEEIYAALPEAVQLWQQDKNSDAPSAATFRQHLHLQEINCEADGSITAWLYNDEHLAGHIIYACLNSDSSLAEAGLEG